MEYQIDFLWYQHLYYYRLCCDAPFRVLFFTQQMRRPDIYREVCKMELGHTSSSCNLTLQKLKPTDFF
jgi:hypothetical protein